MKSKKSRLVTLLQKIRKEKPKLPKRIFGEYLYYKINWKVNYLVVIERTLEWGNLDEWREMVRFYGHDVVVRVLKNELGNLSSFIVPKVCCFFNLDISELACNRPMPFADEVLSTYVDRHYGWDMHLSS